MNAHTRHPAFYTHDTQDDGAERLPVALRVFIIGTLAFSCWSLVGFGLLVAAG